MENRKGWPRIDIIKSQGKSRVFFVRYRKVEGESSDCGERGGTQEEKHFRGKFHK